MSTQDAKPLLQAIHELPKDLKDHLKTFLFSGWDEDDVCPQCGLGEIFNDAQEEKEVIESHFNASRWNFKFRWVCDSSCDHFHRLRLDYLYRLRNRTLNAYWN